MPDATPDRYTSPADGYKSVMTVTGHHLMTVTSHRQVTVTSHQQVSNTNIYQVIILIIDMTVTGHMTRVHV